MFSFFCQSARQSLVTNLAGSGPGEGRRCSVLRATWLLPVPNCQSWRASGAALKTLQELNRAVFTPGFEQSFHVFLGLVAAENFFDGGQGGSHFRLTLMAQRALPLFHGVLPNV